MTENTGSPYVIRAGPGPCSRIKVQCVPSCHMESANVSFGHVLRRCVCVRACVEMSYYAAGWNQFRGGRLKGGTARSAIMPSMVQWRVMGMPCVEHALGEKQCVAMLIASLC